ncbi:MAG: membrane integrity-associated transporter subunit PqiC [Rubrivivax sp.]|nr:membrane integrity-associated transporter subunit PqiC [Rubrivivax sp.]
MTRPVLLRTRRVQLLLALLLPLLSSCVTVEVGGEPAANVQLSLTDARPDVTRRAQTIVDALLIQAQPAQALGDTQAIAYSRRENEYAFYQYATWTERPVRRLPQLLQRRLQARGVATAVGMLGDPLRADWLLVIGVDDLHHDVRVAPGRGRLALTAGLYDRRTRVRVAQRHFVTTVAAGRADSAAAVAALSEATADVFDALLPWVETELQQGVARAR